ncbi:MAG TPA: hypothetical protein VN039_13790, partial [Nitrospira sp.]|nr:hypothetical protein [Nitrospira sp.]
MIKFPANQPFSRALSASSSRTFLTLCALALTLSTLSGCGESNVKIPVVPSRTELPSLAPSKVILTPAQEQDIQIQLATAHMEPIGDSLQTTGKVQAISNLMGHTYCPVPGQAASVLVSIGQNIHQGQPLAWIRSDQIGQLETDFLQNYLQN